MDTDLLSLFDTIEKKSVSLFSDEDMEQVNNYWGTFRKAFDRLVDNWKLFSKMDSENTDDLYKMEKGYEHYYIRQPLYGGGDDLASKLARVSFSYKYDILNCEKLMKEMCSYVESHIIRFFNKKYGCSLESKNVLANSSLFDDHSRYTGVDPDLQVILDEIIRQNDGLSFAEKGELDTILGFGKIVDYRVLSLSGKTVSIDSMVSYSDYGSRRTLYSDSWWKVQLILEAIAYCFHGTKGLYTIIKHDDLSRLQEMEVGEAFIFEKKFKLEQIKYFKNSKLGIKFVTAEQAKQFYEFLSEAKEKYKNIA